MPRISLRVSDDFAKQLDVRTGFPRVSISETIRESLSRYFYLLNIEIERVVIKDVFTPGELSLIVDICNGTYWEAHSIPFGVIANVEDAEDCYFEQWGIDRTALVNKLKKLTNAQHFALVDAVERFWVDVANHPSLGKEVRPGDILKLV